MDERHWMVCAEPLAMLDYLLRRGRVSERKCRLFAVACCRRIWPLLTEPARNAVEIAERLADGLASSGDSFQADVPLQEFIEGYVYADNNTWSDRARPLSGVLAAKGAVDFDEEYHNGILYGATQASRHAAFAVGPRNAASTDDRCSPESARQAELVRCIFGSPFSRPRFEPWWRTETVVDLARKMYEDRDFAVMPILTDALEEAGCENVGILGHCREPGVHVRGCWVVDLVLDRE